LFYKKAKFWQATRNFLIKKGFLEVETPALENTAGGADAQPFVTHHNALDIDVYLRISMGELWQKRLMVAGFEKTFEIGRQFRNEGISREHLQDYSQMEFYWAYANYEDSMKLVEELYKYIAQETFGTQKFKIGEFDVDLSAEWPMIDFVSVIKEKQGIDVLVATDDEIKDKLRSLNVKFAPKDRKGRLMDLLWKQIRKKIAGPAFLINHPVDVSPLAKRKEDNPELVERYQVILAGSEMGNGYSELNDPIDQAERFREQSEMRDEGDTEAQMHDRDFVEALEYGMPPTTGFGFSERLFSFLADKSGREAQLFPLMRPVQAEVDKSTSKE
jgi:lysyl-tRNA synthetase class 2